MAAISRQPLALNAHWSMKEIFSGEVLAKRAARFAHADLAPARHVGDEHTHVEIAPVGGNAEVALAPRVVVLLVDDGAERGAAKVHAGEFAQRLRHHDVAVQEDHPAEPLRHDPVDVEFHPVAHRPVPAVIETAEVDPLGPDVMQRDAQRARVGAQRGPVRLAQVGLEQVERIAVAAPRQRYQQRGQVRHVVVVAQRQDAHVAGYIPAGDIGILAGIHIFGEIVSIVRGKIATGAQAPGAGAA